MKILLTGKPRSGKTTLVKKVISRLKDRKIAGFYTDEVKVGNERVGFDLVNISTGKRIPFASKEKQSIYKVGKYGVDIKSFEDFLDEIDLQKGELLIVDEVGKMECFSTKFRRWLLSSINDFNDVLITVPLKGTEFIEDFKKNQKDFIVFEIDQENREIVYKKVLDLLGRD